MKLGPRSSKVLRSCATFGTLLGIAVIGRGQALGPVSTYFVTAGDQRNVHAVQGSTVVSTFTTASGGREYPVFVLNSSIVTSGSSGSESGRVYTLAGVAGSTVLPFSLSGGASAWDAATDGVSAYLMDYSFGVVYRTALDYSAPVALFGGLGNSAFLGITFDPSNNSLWISGWNSSEVRNYSLTGTLLSSFTGPTSSLTCLALDPATGTLWMGSQNQQGKFWEYSRTGAQLQSVTFASLASQNTLGGEFAFTAVPEPATWLQLLGGLVLVAAVARGRRR